LALLGRVVEETQHVIDGVTPEQLSAPSPCTEWTVRDLINHVTAGSEMFALAAEHGAVPDADVSRLMGGDNLGDDYRGAFRTASNKALEVFNRPGMLDQTVKLPFGEMPASVALDIAVCDVAIHAADIARATGQKVGDDEMLEGVLAVAQRIITSDWRAPGIFGQEQPADEDASAEDKLLAFAGRKV